MIDSRSGSGKAQEEPGISSRIRNEGRREDGKDNSFTKTQQKDSGANPKKAPPHPAQAKDGAI